MPSLAWAAMESSSIGRGLWGAHYRAPSYQRSSNCGEGYSPKSGFIFRITWSTELIYVIRTSFYGKQSKNLYCHYYASCDNAKIRQEEKEYHKNRLQQYSHM